MTLSRRSFLKRLGIGASALAVAPLLPPVPEVVEPVAEISSNPFVYVDAMGTLSAGPAFRAGHVVTQSPSSSSVFGIALNNAEAWQPVTVMRQGVIRVVMPPDGVYHYQPPGD